MGPDAPASAPSPGDSVQNYRSVKDIDFGNFAYDWDPDLCDTPRIAKRVVLAGGLMAVRCGRDQDPLEFSLDSVKYGDLTGDGNEEAIVIIRILMAGTARPHLIFVYSLSQHQPKRLWVYETGDRAQEGLHSVLVENGQLVIELYKASTATDDSGQPVVRSTSDSYTRNYYTWDGNKFFKTKAEERPTDPSDKSPWVESKPTPP